jgi:hypothetical protein
MLAIKKVPFVSKSSFLIRSMSTIPESSTSCNHPKHIVQLKPLDVEVQKWETRKNLCYWNFVSMPFLFITYVYGDVGRIGDHHWGGYVFMAHLGVGIAASMYANSKYADAVNIAHDTYCDGK